MRFLLIVVLASWPGLALGQDALVTAGGAACDGTTDDTAAINALLAQSRGGGLFTVPAGRLCLINSADLIVPRNVIVRGASSSRGVMGGSHARSSGFLLNPAFTIAMADGASLRDLSILRSTLESDPTDAQAIAAVARWGSETSRAITLRGGGVMLEHLFIEGFNTAVYGHAAGDFLISDVIGDTYNGIFVTAAADNTAILDTRFEPFYCIDSKNCWVGDTLPTARAQTEAGPFLRFAAERTRPIQQGDHVALLAGPDSGHIPPGTTVAAVDHDTGEVTLSAPTTAPVAAGQAVTVGGAWARPGISFYLQGNATNTTGWYCVRCFSFMYRGGIVLDGVGVGYLEQSGFEWQHSFDPATTGKGVIGVRMVGLSTGITISDSYSGGHAIEVSDELVTRPVELHNLSMGYPDFLFHAAITGPSPVAGLFLAGKGGPRTTVTIDGPVSEGDTISVAINGITISYTVRRGDARFNVLSELARRINSNPLLAASHISAGWMNDSVDIGGPAATALTVAVTATGGIKVAKGTAPGSLGSWGQLAGYTSAGPTDERAVPAILVGPDQGLPFRITGFPLSNTGGLAGAIAIDPTSVTSIQLQDLPAASGIAPSQCGDRPTLSPGATDARGIVTEGSGASGCTLTFRRPWPVTPVCTLSSPNGAPFSGYAASATALTITNPKAGGGQYAYSCQP